MDMYAHEEFSHTYHNESVLPSKFHYTCCILEYDHTHRWKVEQLGCQHVAVDTAFARMIQTLGMLDTGCTPRNTITYSHHYNDQQVNK